jgi:hypothetical protein
MGSCLSDFLLRCLFLDSAHHACGFFFFSVRVGAVDFRFVIFDSSHRFPRPPVSTNDFVFSVNFSCRASNLCHRSSFFDLSFLGLAAAGPCLPGHCIRFPLHGFPGLAQETAPGSNFSPSLFFPLGARVFPRLWSTARLGFSLT